MIMRKLTRGMWKKLHEAKKHAELAHSFKAEYPEASALFLSMANEELAQSKKMYEHSIKLAEKTKANESEERIPNWLKENWMQEQQDYIEKFAKIKHIIEM